jgi:hypothetical protein
LVTVSGEEPKAFGSSALALEYKHNFCDPDRTKMKEIILFERAPATSSSSDEDGYGSKPSFDPSDHDL